jgi:hypothetical protein
MNINRRRTLAYWERQAKKQIFKWLNDDDFRESITKNTLSKDENPPGPFTKFLYYFAARTQAGWGVMVDFNERNQKVFLTDHYYKWMHKLRDELNQVEDADK